YILLGMLMVCAISILPLNSESIEQSNGIFELLLLFFAGIIAAIALLLPGISISYLLLLLGLYSKTITAIKALQFSFLLPMALGDCSNDSRKKQKQKFEYPIGLLDA